MSMGTAYAKYKTPTAADDLQLSRSETIMVINQPGEASEW